MAIRVAHGTNIAPQLAASFGAGQERRRLEDSRDALRRIDSRKERQFRANQNLTNIIARQQEQRNRRNFTIQQNELERERFLSDRTFEDLREDEAADVERRLAQEERDFDFVYSDKQREEYNQLTDAYDEAVASGEFSQDELAELKARTIQKQDAIQPQRRLKKRSRFDPGQDIGDVWRTDSGTLLTRDEKGNIKKLEDPKKVPTVKDITSLYQQAYNTLDKGDGTAIDRSAVKDFVKDALKLHQEIVNETSGSDVRVTEELIAGEDSDISAERSPEVTKEIIGPFAGEVKTKQAMIVDFEAEEGRRPTDDELERLRRLGGWA
jgi:hypothetical protein